MMTFKIDLRSMIDHMLKGRWQYSLALLSIVLTVGPVISFDKFRDNDERASWYIAEDVATIRYVHPEGKGKGESWQQALGSLAEALSVAQTGDVIWVAAGKYYPTTDGDRSKSFVIPSGVAVLGGFMGTEKQARERNWQLHRTILSGNIGDRADSLDNSRTVVRFAGVHRRTVLDGVSIRDGVADGLEQDVSPAVVGAGIFNDGSRQPSSPTIRNCVIIDNYAREGAGMYNYSKGGKTAPVIENTKFFRNRSDFNGGAIMNDGDEGTSNPHIKDCNFEANIATYGGAIFNQAKDGLCKPIILNCMFIDNISLVRGSAIYNFQDEFSTVDPIVRTCRFDNNAASAGDAIEDTRNIISTGKSKGKIQLRSGH